MKYRKLDALLHLDETAHFQKLFGLQCTLLNNSIWLYNEHGAIQCYGLEVEDFLYMIAISLDRTTYLPLTTLVNSVSKNELKRIYHNVQEEITVPQLESQYQNSSDSALKAQRYYVTYLRILSTFFSEKVRNGFTQLQDMLPCSADLQTEIQLLRKNTR